MVSEFEEFITFICSYSAENIGEKGGNSSGFISIRTDFSCQQQQGERNWKKGKDLITKRWLYGKKTTMHTKAIWKVLNNLGKIFSLTCSTTRSACESICWTLECFQKKNCERWIKNLCLISIEKYCIHWQFVENERVRQKEIFFSAMCEFSSSLELKIS